MRTGRARWIGATAGLAPTTVIGGWWAWSGVGGSAVEALESIALLALIAMTAGCIAGPLAVTIPRTLLKATIGYAIAVILTTIALFLIQGFADAISVGDASVGGIAMAVAVRALVAVPGIAYLILPAIAFGALWAVAARMIMRLP